MSKRAEPRGETKTAAQMVWSMRIDASVTSRVDFATDGVAINVSEDPVWAPEFEKRSCSRSSRVLHVRVSAQLGKVARRRSNYSAAHKRKRIRRGMESGTRFIKSSEETNLRSGRGNGRLGKIGGGRFGWKASLSTTVVRRSRWHIWGEHVEYKGCGRAVPQLEPNMGK